MIRETTVSLSPKEVMDLATSFFTGLESGYSGTLIERGEGFARFQTFRGNLALTARQQDGRTRVRCSTLRYHPSIGKLLLNLENTSSPRTA